MTSKGKKQDLEPEPAVQPQTLEAMASESQVDFEMRFLGRILERHPSYVDVLRVMGNNMTLKGRHRDGLEIDRQLVRLRPHDALAHYNLACSLALLRRAEMALRALRRALELGYRDFKYIRQDHDLDALRADPRYRQLMAEFENR